MDLKRLQQNHVSEFFAQHAFFLMIGEPIAHRPRPGGRNFISKILRNMSSERSLACDEWNYRGR